MRKKNWSRKSPDHLLRLAGDREGKSRILASSLILVVVPASFLLMVYIIAGEASGLHVVEGFTRSDWLVCCHETVFGERDHTVTEWRKGSDCSPTAGQEYPAVLPDSTYRFAVNQTVSFTDVWGREVSKVNCGRIAVRMGTEVITASKPSELYGQIGSVFNGKSYPGEPR